MGKTIAVFFVKIFIEYKKVANVGEKWYNVNGII